MITANSRNRRLATCSPVSLRKAGLTLGARANLSRSVGYKPTAKGWTTSSFPAARNEAKKSF